MFDVCLDEHHSLTMCHSSQSTFTLMIWSNLWWSMVLLSLLLVQGGNTMSTSVQLTKKPKVDMDMNVTKLNTIHLLFDAQHLVLLHENMFPFDVQTMNDTQEGNQTFALNGQLNETSSSGYQLVHVVHSTDDEVNNGNHTINYSIEILDKWPWQVFLVTLYSGTAALSLTLNIATIYVLLKSDRSISTELWKFLVNLSVADIGMSVFCIPFTYTEIMLQQWVFPHHLCPLVKFAQLCSVFVSVWTLTIIGIDRYFAIVHPLYMLHWLRSNKMTIIGATWLIGATFASTQFYLTRTVSYRRSGKELFECREVWSDEFYEQIFTVVIFVLTFALPVSILIYVYMVISFHIVSHVMPGNPHTERDRQQMNKKVKVLKMLITIVCLFAICWLPIHIFQLLVYFVPNILKVRSRTTYALFYAFFFSSHFLSMAHSLVNPIVYCFMSENFRFNFWHLLNRTWGQYFQNCNSTNTSASEHVELDVANETFTSYNSRTRKTLTVTVINYHFQRITAQPVEINDTKGSAVCADWPNAHQQQQSSRSGFSNTNWSSSSFGTHSNNTHSSLSIVVASHHQ